MTQIEDDIKRDVDLVINELEEGLEMAGINFFLKLVEPIAKKVKMAGILEPVVPEERHVLKSSSSKADLVKMMTFDQLSAQ